MLKLWEKYKYIILTFIVCCIGMGSLRYTPKEAQEFILETNDENQDLEVQDLTVNSALATTPETLQMVPVYICGEVKHPDVYYLPEDALVKDVVEAAGGYTDLANEEYLNLASKIVANGQLIVPKVGEEIDKNSNSYENRVCDNSQNLESGNQTSRININTATVEEIVNAKLYRIGEKTAEKIIAYREEHGGFKDIKELNNVKGIGDAIYNNIEDRVTVQ